MPYKVLIPAELDAKYPELTIDEKRWIVMANFRHLGEVARDGPLRFKMPHVGTFKTHGNKKSCFQKKFISRERAIIERKRTQRLELTKEFLLF